MGQFNWEIYMRVLVGLIAAFGTCWGLTDPRDVVAINNLYAALGSPPLPGWVPNWWRPVCRRLARCTVRQCQHNRNSFKWREFGGCTGRELGAFASIIQIDMSNNHIGGSIPSNLPITIRSFSLSGNQFTGSIPETFSSLGQLTDMSLSNNHLTGVIPDTFQQLTGLINLHLQDNRLAGTLDILQVLPLIDLNIENNLFSGPIPPKLLAIPTFRIAGNPFNTTFLPSPPALTPSLSSFGAPPPKQVPRIRLDEPSAPENSHSSKGQNLLSKRVVLIAIVALVIVIVLALGLCLFMSKCCKGRPLTNEVPERHGMDADDYPKDNPKHNMLPKSYGHTEHARKVAEQEKEVPAVPKHKEDHEKDTTEMDGNILPPPPLPPLLNPFEKVIARPDVAPVTFKKLTLEKLSSTRTFSIASLQQYTQSFSQENLLGGGMLGTVYRAELPDGKLLAVKTLDVAASRQLSDEDFLEFVSRVSKLQHANIVQLWVSVLSMDNSYLYTSILVMERFMKHCT